MVNRVDKGVNNTLICASTLIASEETNKIIVGLKMLGSLEENLSEKNTKEKLEIFKFSFQKIFMLSEPLVNNLKRIYSGESN